MSIQYSHPFSVQQAYVVPTRSTSLPLTLLRSPAVLLTTHRKALDDANRAEGLEQAPLPETSSEALLERLSEVEDALEGYNLVSSDSSQLAYLSRNITEEHTLGADAVPRVERLLASISHLLAIPAACRLEKEDLEPSMILERERFLHHSPALLTLALSLVLLIPLPPTSTRKPTLETLESRSKLVLCFARFTDDELSPSFCATTAPNVAIQITERLFGISNRHALISHILSKSFPPLFKPHPKLNPATGRVLSKPKGGDRGLMDWYEEGEDLGWRDEMGMANVVRVVIGALKLEEVEDIWPMILPPLLAFLDDYQPLNKLHGTSILCTLLPLVSASLLRRTGVGKVFTQSLSASLSALSSPHTPPLLLQSTRVSLNLLNLLHPPLPATSASSLARFNALCTLLTNSTITPWSFHSGQIPLEISIVTFLPLLINELGTGTIRYLQILVPHLSGLVGDTSVGEGTWELVGKACEVLELVLRIAKSVGRGGRWKGVVGAAVGKCWARLGEMEQSEERKNLERCLRTVLEAIDDGGEVGKRLAKVGKAFEGLVSVGLEVQ
ncbi:hypothetical protein P7C70_g4179, partial [Phenoliferia sp. Uapishka_3]